MSGTQGGQDAARAGASPTVAGDESRLQLSTRIAWMYFVEGLKQDEVAAALGISRMRVNRLLASAREEGLVRIEVDSPYSACSDCEARLRKAFGLRRAVVVPAPLDPDRTGASVGHALGALLNNRIADGMTVGVQHGRTAHALFHGLRPANMPETAVVSIKGSLSPVGRIVTHETVARMSLTLQAKGYQLAAPCYARSVEERDLFMALPIVESVIGLARSCDLAVMTANRTTVDGGFVTNGFVSPQEARDLRACGAVGAVLGTFVDRDGRPVDHELNRRCIGLDIEDLGRIPEVILTGSGAGKVVPMRAALARGEIHTLVTDEETASAIMAG